MLTNSGADAAAAGVLFAQSFTGRDRFMVFSPEAPAGGETWSYGDPGAIERLRTDPPAAIVIEPVPAALPSLDHAAWLAELADTAGVHGVLVIFDESYTGFRLAFGGAQELLGLMPDMTIFGRAVGGGLPLGALAGRADIMQGRNVPAASPGNLISIAAGVATLRELLAQRLTLYPKLNESGRRLAGDFNAFCAAESLPVAMHGVGSMFRVAFAASSAAETAFYLFALSRSIFINASKTGFLSAAHRAAELDYAASALAESLRDVRDDGFFAADAGKRASQPARARGGDVHLGEMP